MKKLSFVLSIVLTSLTVHATIHVVRVWDGYFQFLPNEFSVELGDTIQWLPLDPPSVVHTITSASIPAGASSFDQIWQSPSDTFFQYIPLVAGFYEYVCTPHAVSFNMVGNFTVTGGTSSARTDQNAANNLKFGPNPSRGIIRFHELHQLNYVVYSTQGSILRSGISNDGEIDISTLTNGLYVIQIAADRPCFIRIVKQ
jgi:plastocyanin